MASQTYTKTDKLFHYIISVIVVDIKHLDNILSNTAFNRIVIGLRPQGVK